MNLSVREMEKSEIELIVDYFFNADSEFLKGMGADIKKLPNREEWTKKLNSDYEKPYDQKEFYYIIWLINGEPTGHSNINNIDFGQSAKMHLHLWKNNNRKSGLGLNFIKQTLPFFYKNFKLKTLICEPFSENIPPNKVLKKAGFKFIKSYKTIPGFINFSQIVNRYQMTLEESSQIKIDTHFD